MTDHWIVAGTRLGSSGSIAYRRERLAHYLGQRPGTGRVFWVCFRRRQRAAVTFAERPGVCEVILRDPLDLLRYVPSARVPRPLRNCINSQPSGERMLWFTHPSAPFLARLPGWKSIVYDCSDMWSAPWDDRDSHLSITAAMDRVRRAAIARAEREIVGCASHVFVTVPPLASHVIAEYARVPNALIENGVDFARFASADPLPTLGSPRLIYTGALKPSVDFALLASLAKAMPHAEILLVGPVSPRSQFDLDRLLREPNVRRVAAVPADEVPRLLSSASVGLMPYRETDWTKAASPLKLFEYLAAGLPVVGIGVPATESHCGDGVYVHVDDEASFIRACADLDGQRSMEIVRRRRALAERQDWGAKFEAMVEIALGELAMPYAMEAC